MRGRHILCLLGLATVLSGCRVVEVIPLKGRGLLLARSGRALMPVVVSERAGAVTRSAAGELAQYLERITGARFEVTSGDGQQGIVLGTLQDFPALDDPSLRQALEIRNVFDGKEAYVIRTEPGRVLLLGATELGASHAAFRLLEEIGCRWFFPAKEWEVVPSVPKLRVKVNLEDRPAVLARRIWYGFGYFDRQCHEDYAAWARHNRMASSLVVSCGHAWDSIIARYKDVFEAHPEYLALITEQDKQTGAVTQKRGGNKFCISNPGLVELCQRFALEYFAQNPGADMVSMEPSDGLGYCQCAECAKMGTVSDQVFYLANEVAKAVAQKYPGKMVGLYAYSEHSEPPAFELEPNVYVQLTAGFIRGRYSYDELLDLWPKKCPSMGFYEYFSVYLWDWDMLPGGTAANILHLSRKIPMLAGRQATSIDAESGDNWGVHGRGYYVANRLMWNPRADVQAILEDFYEKAFGPAAGPMKRYYERLDPGSEPLMSEHLIGLAFRDVEEAGRLAAGRPDVQARLDDVKVYLRYFHLRWMLDRTGDKDQKKKLTQELFAHVYRTRRTYMNHWEAIRQCSTVQAAEQFGEPTWSMSGPGAPWADAPPYTREEIDAFFREGLSYFQPEQVSELSYSDRLVPVRFREAQAGLNAERGMFQGGLTYAVYSVEGEALSVTVTTGIIAWYRNFAPARYSFRSADGTTLAEGRLPLDGEKHVLTVEVPGPGLYYLDFNDSSAGWTIEADADRPLTVPLRRASGYLHHGRNSDLYFYVPKGTAQVQYYWRGGPHRVHGPDGQIVAEVKDSGKFVRAPVTPGSDGQLWRLSEIALGHLWFFNVPNYLATAPNALMVPEEVAAKDGLAVRRAGQ